MVDAGTRERMAEPVGAEGHATRLRSIGSLIGLLSEGRGGPHSPKDFAREERREAGMLGKTREESHGGERARAGKKKKGTKEKEMRHLLYGRAWI